MSYAYLVMVTPNNNNKFYEMKLVDNEIELHHGRIDQSRVKTKNKPASKWKSIYNSKIRKGYTDRTKLFAEPVKNSNSSRFSHPFQKKMLDYTESMFDSNYKIDISKVTQLQIDEAKNLISKLKSPLDEDTANKTLCNLYSVIPRKMKNVKEHLIPRIKLEDILEEEQNNLDAVEMVSQSSDDPSETIYDIVDHVDFEKDENIKYIIDQLKSSDASYHSKVNIESVYKINKNDENHRIEKWIETRDNKDTQYLIHGTKCKSVLPILNQGLKIWPSGNFTFAGKVYGNGNYFSNKTKKSLNYTGYEKDKILLIYECHVGNPFIYNGWYKGNKFKLEWEELNSRGYDSTFVKAGNGLLNEEIICYREEQACIRYIIHLQ